MLKRFLLLILMAFGCGAGSLSANEPEKLSLLRLIANPQAFDGKLVRVFGFVTVKFEGDAIYLHQEDYLHGLSINALWVDFPEQEKRPSDFDKTYVLMEGIFQAGGKGHGGLFSGTIGKIQRIQVWSRPGKPRVYNLPAGRVPKMTFQEAEPFATVGFLIAKLREIDPKYSVEYRYDRETKRPFISLEYKDVPFVEAFEEVLSRLGLDYEQPSEYQIVIIEAPKRTITK